MHNRANAMNSRRYRNNTESDSSPEEIVYRQMAAKNAASASTSNYKQINDERLRNLQKLIDDEDASSNGSFSIGAICCKLFFFLIVLLGILMATLPIFNLKHPLKASYIK
mgnify:CR=1 FL=1